MLWRIYKTDKYNIPENNHVAETRSEKVLTEWMRKGGYTAVRISERKDNYGEQTGWADAHQIAYCKDGCTSYKLID